MWDGELDERMLSSGSQQSESLSQLTYARRPLSCLIVALEMLQAKLIRSAGQILA